MKKFLSNQKYKNNLYRKFLFYYYIVEKIKRFLKLNFRLICIFLFKTVQIKDLVESGYAYAQKIFNGEIYYLNQKLDINKKEFKYLPIGRYKIPDYYIYTIKNGIIKTGSNSIFSEDKRRIRGINYQELPSENYFIKKINNKKIETFKGKLLILGVGLIEKNYSHAWTELAARAYAVKLSKIDYDYILLDSENNFVPEILALIGMPKKKFIFSNRFEYIKASNLIYPELINNYKEYFLNGVFIYHRKYLPSWIKSLYDEVSSRVALNNLSKGLEKIYISRKNKKERNIINEYDLELNLKKLGFKTIYFEDYKVVDQIRIMKNAKQIIAIHGAGLVNINFCKKGTNILELFPFYYQCAFFYMHANMCNLNYDYYIGEPINRLWKRSPIMENFYVDVSKINLFIEKNWNK